MTVQEMKKVLERFPDVQDLINRLQAEIEKLKAETTIKAVGGIADLIKQQQAEIERLTEENEDIKGNWRKMKTDQENTCEECRELFAKAKSEARKEFAERLYQISKWLPLTVMQQPFVTINDIDNLLAEMDGKEKENA